MKRSFLLFLKLACVASLALGLLGLKMQVPSKQVLAGSVNTIAFKARIIEDKGQGNVTEDLIFRVYDQSVGGKNLFQEEQTVNMRDDIAVAFIGSATKGGLPPDIFQLKEVWVEVSRASDPNTNLGNRTPVGTGAGHIEGGIGLVSVCFTCGGTFGVFEGAIAQGGGAEGFPLERGSGCAGDPGPSTDTFPFICSQ